MNAADNPFFRTLEISDVTLRVRDLSRIDRFYRDALGLVSRKTGNGTALSTAPDAPPLLRLQHAPGAAIRREGEAGLFHVAILFPDRGSLAQAARRLVRLDVSFGASGHGVSEALYLADPEGNGIELYADRPVEDWPASDDGENVNMHTLHLDVGALLAAEAETQPPAASVPAGTHIGHVHLSVSDLGRSEALYRGVVGFRVRQRNYAGALFLGLDGYHHHLAINVWQSSRPAAPGSAGLASLTLAFHDSQAFEETRGRMAAEEPGATGSGESLSLNDPDGWTIRVARDFDLRRDEETRR
ncbi:MAG: VOC family protein [Opitutaceae bacterium]